MSSTQQAQSAAGAAGQAAIGDPTSLGYQMLGHLPGAGTVTAWNMGRGINTIMGGDYSKGRRFGNFGKTNKIFPSSIANTLSPLRLGSFSDPANITGRRAGQDVYTPFNVLARGGNWASKRLAGRAVKQADAQGMIDATDTKIGQKALSRLGLNDAQVRDMASGGNTKVFDGGVLARLGASQRLAYMRPGKDGELSRGNRKRLAKSIYSMDRMGIQTHDIPGAKGVLSSANRGMGAESLRRRVGGGAGTARLAAGRMMGSFNGVATQRMAGYLGGTMPINASKGGAAFQKAFHSSRMGMIDGTHALNKTGAAGKAFGRKGATVATGEVLEAGGRQSLRLAGTAYKAGEKKFAGQLAVKGLTKIGSRAIPVVGWAMLAADLGGMALAGVKKGAELTKDGIKSFQGQIQKPIFGMGYKDNAINATSRSRGLTAIQSSRLNARNALGHEAGMMSSHFG